MRPILFALSAAALLLPMIAKAADIPHRKPGLWLLETQNSNSTRKMEQKLCLDAASDAALQKLGGQMAGGASCSKHDLTRNGNQLVYDGVCTMMGSTITSHGVTTFTGDTAYHTESKAHWDPPMMGHADTTTVQDGKWSGACPADMKPGDMIMPGGMKMNINDMGSMGMGGMKPPVH
jgi:hypothetical protein